MRRHKVCKTSYFFWQVDDVNKEVLFSKQTGAINDKKTGKISKKTSCISLFYIV